MKKVYDGRASLIIYNFLRSIKSKGKFIMPANICPIVPAIFHKAKKEIVFFDINKETFSIDEKFLLEELDKNIKNYSGILWTNGYGSKKNNDELFLKIKKLYSKFIIIDDKCLSIPEVNIKKNIVSDLEIYSTGYGKYVDFNYGGFAYINIGNVYEKNLINYSSSDHEELINKFNESINTGQRINMSNSNWLGSNKKNFNQKDYDIQLNDALKIIGKHKTQINQIYESNIQKEAQIKNDYNNWRFNIYVNRKKDLIKSLFENKLFASSHYYSAGKMFEDKNFTNTDYVSDNIVNLFNDLRFDIKKAEKACEIINSHLTQFGTPSN